jgi:hypothetical protein
MASLSTNSKVVVNNKSGHHVQWEEPEFVIESVKKHYEAAKHHSAL